MANSLKAKSLCKLKSELISKHIDEIAAITRNSQYVCSKCARSSEGKKWLCKPVAI
ncbi:hypothetical protein Q4508_04145 [Amphritea sp. 2_MG-2023]|jgi:hypothetical protein|uniref:hypothetical protein n=1 Tax=Amphritea TaxID=515417 RepID=UPI001C06E036|nr:MULTISPECIES: hypothetical protein [Amphritea]MBU2964412.1 hypothetical protein [Amphritea atlantica]MDO6417740.1 hypothetical protein [Amphritea sp. 2_MG-2023]MDX2424347.1 hypothetical protein [Amphritea sp.]